MEATPTPQYLRKAKKLYTFRQDLPVGTKKKFALQIYKCLKKVHSKIYDIMVHPATYLRKVYDIQNNKVQGKLSGDTLTTFLLDKGV